MKQLFGIVIFSLLLSSVSFAQCPNLTGAWKCTSSEGEKWTEDISMSSPTAYVIVYDKGTPSEEKDTIHADGRVITESVKLKKMTTSIVEKAVNFITNYLPQLTQLSIIGERLKKSKFEPAQASSTVQVTCQNNESIERYQINMTGRMTSMLQLKANAVGVSKVSINKSGKQIRLIGDSIEVSGQSSISLLKQSLEPQHTKSSSFVICEK